MIHGKHTFDWSEVCDVSWIVLLPSSLFALHERFVPLSNMGIIQHPTIKYWSLIMYTACTKCQSNLKKQWTSSELSDSFIRSQWNQCIKLRFLLNCQNLFAQTLWPYVFFYCYTIVINLKIVYNK